RTVGGRGREDSGDRGPEDEPAGADHLGLLRRGRLGPHGPGAPRDHRREVEVAARKRDLHGPGQDVRRSGRSTLTSSSLYPNLFPYLLLRPSMSTLRPRYRYIP